LDNHLAAMAVAFIGSWPEIAPMLVIPVLDLKHGKAVRSVAGQREDYAPIVSTLTTSSRPADVARAFRERLGLTELYVADLDAIAGAEPAFAVYRILYPSTLWLDAGVRGSVQAARLAKAGIDKVVVGLETVDGPHALAVICRELGAERVVFSLDLKDGVPLGDPRAWDSDEPWSIAQRAIAVGVRQVIVLDLARVGMLSGTGTEELCGRLARADPTIQVIAGGGVRNAADLHRLRSLGLGGVLTASALHDGTVRRSQLAAVSAH
jgi:phosphoribosylformimino-5-aminoimidazole carboxamide ribotide isomerase